jgi:tetratricopeptide (TPR) repeat protein
LADLERGVFQIAGREQKLDVDGILYLSARTTGLSLERIYADVGRMLGEPIRARLAARWTERDTPLAAKIEYLLEVMLSGLYLILLDDLGDYLTREGEIADEGLGLFVQRCLTLSAGAKLVGTSRIEIQHPPRSRHATRCIPLRDGLPEDDGIALLRDLDPQEELGLCNASESDLRPAVQLTLGIPRALELVAGILDYDRASNLTRLLANERLFGEEVVEHLVAEGYTHLGDGERRVMEALAVFDLPVEETAVVFLLHPWFPDLDVRAALRRLTRAYFASVNRVTSEYSLHPLDREYSYRQLPVSDELGVYSQRNLELRAADFYVSIRKPQNEWKMIDDLQPQLNEFKHRVQAGDHDTAARLVQETSSEYLIRWGHAQHVISMGQRLSDKVSDESLRNRLLGDMGRAHAHLGQYELAVKHYKSALATARASGDRASEGHYLGYLGRAHRNLEEYELSEESHRRALDILREIGDRRAESANLCNLGITLRNMGYHEKSIEHLGRSLTISGEIGDKHLEGRALMNLGKAHMEIGQTQKAIECHERALGILRKIGYRREEGDTLCPIGWAYDNLGEHRQAIEFYEQGLKIMREIGDRRGEANHLLSLGGAHLKLNDFERAIRYLIQAREIAEEVGKHSASHFANRYLTEAYLQKDRLKDALDTISLTIGYSLPLYNDRADALRGIVLARLGRREHARSAFKDAVISANELLEKTPRYFRAQYTLGLALAGKALLASDHARTESLVAEAQKAYEDALAICSDRGVIADAVRLLNELRSLDRDGLLNSIITLLQKPKLPTNPTTSGDDK